MVDPGCVAFPYVCIAYDVCKLGKSPWQCKDLPKEVIDEIVRQWAEAGSCYFLLNVGLVRRVWQRPRR